MSELPYRFNELSTLRGLDDAAEAKAPLPGVLRIVHSLVAASTGTHVRIEPDESLVIGRDVDVGLRLPDLRASRLHCRIVWDAGIGTHRCGDAHSANGTFVNGKRVESVPLCANDVIRVGDTLLVYSREVEPWTPAIAAKGPARSSLPLLIQGETGSGKELLAREIHAASGRRGPFVAVNCAALPTSIAAAELFGHTRGAFSGAGAARKGLFRAAAGGTILLDEIAECAPELQSSLLRVLQEQKVRPLGSDDELEIDVRVISATHVDLGRAVEEGRFREDLYGRLAQLVTTVPPLRARRTELFRLIRELVPALAFSTGAAEAMLLWTFPRNVRELKALVESLRDLRGDEAIVQLSDLMDKIPSAKLVKERKEAPASEIKDAQVDAREQLSQLLALHSGNISQVARAMNKPRAHVYRWMRVFGLTKTRS